MVNCIHLGFIAFWNLLINFCSVLYIYIYNTFCQAMDDGKEVRAIFCDISKAFDRVWHKGLLFKLHSVSISGSLFQWFTDYLYNK